jgi:hypothetical protein
MILGDRWPTKANRLYAWNVIVMQHVVEHPSSKGNNQQGDNKRDNRD